MENKIKVESWIKEIDEEIKNNLCLNFSLNDSLALRIANEDFEEIYQLLKEGKTIPIANLGVKKATLSEEIEAFKEAHNFQKFIYTSSPYEKQNDTLLDIQSISNKNHLKKSLHNAFITFGLLDYIDENSFNPIAKSAPLLFIPVKITNDEVHQHYFVQSLNNEIYLNEALIQKVLKEKRVDLSYPIDDSFSIFEFLCYIAIKVRPLHWSVNNGCFISNFDLTKSSLLKDSVAHFDSISEKSIIKNVSYFNSEFYRLNHPAPNKFNNKFLALLNADSEEHQILKMVSNKDNLFIRTSSHLNNDHLIQNILSSYLLNNQKLLVVYSNYEQYAPIIEQVKNSWMNDYVVDLNEETLNKKALLSDLVNYDKYTARKGLLDSDTIQDNVNHYYEVKNEYKKIINALRKSNAPLNISLNRSIENYYKFSEYEDLELQLTNIPTINPAKLEEYVFAVSGLKDSVDRLKVKLEDHPFYGFNKMTMVKEDYAPLFEAVVVQSDNIKKGKEALSFLSKRFNFPEVNSLKGLKAILNLYYFLSIYKKDENPYYTNFKFEEEFHAYKEARRYKKFTIDLKENIIKDYSEKAFAIDPSILEHIINNEPLEKKESKELLSLFGKKAMLDDDQLLDLSTRVVHYREENSKYEEMLSNLNPDLKAYIGHEDEELDLILDRVKNYQQILKYFEKHNIRYNPNFLEEMSSSKDFEKIMEYRPKLQVLYNDILKKNNTIQSFFDASKVLFSELDFKVYFDKMQDASIKFSSINDYLDYIICVKHTNKIIPNLANELLAKCSRTDHYERAFLKFFYKTISEFLMKTNPLFKNYTFERIRALLDEYKNFDEKRNEIIISIIKNNYISYFHLNLNSLKQLESSYVNSFINYKDGFLPLSKLTNGLKESIYNLKPVVFVPASKVSALLSSETYKYDAVLYLSDRDLGMKDVLSSFNKGEQIIVIDSENISNRASSNVDETKAQSLVVCAKNSLINVDFTSTSYEKHVLPLNSYDVGFKSYLTKHLTIQGFEAIKDCQTDLGGIDILVRVPNSKTSTAILVDHLYYQSPESAILSIEESKRKVEELGYAFYQVIPSAYFFNQEEQYKSLASYVVKHSKIVRKKPKVFKPLVEVLFKEYKSAGEIFYTSLNKSKLSLDESIKALINLSAPVQKDEIVSLFKEDITESLQNLVQQQEIILKDDFIYLLDKPILFRIVNRNSEEVRALSSVSPLEIKEGIMNIISYQKSIKEEELVKLILLCLGYKKMNNENYNYIVDLIHDLAEKERLVLLDDNVNYPYVEEVE